MVGVGAKPTVVLPDPPKIPTLEEALKEVRFESVRLEETIIVHSRYGHEARIIRPAEVKQITVALDGEVVHLQLHFGSSYKKCGSSSKTLVLSMFDTVTNTLLVRKEEL